MRSGENALDVIERVKAKIEEMRGSLPPGVQLVPVYDRSQLIRHSIETLGTNLVQKDASRLITDQLLAMLGELAPKK